MPPDAAANKQAVCAAILAGALWECERCALSWQDGDKAPACSPVTYARLKARAEAEAARIQQAQDAIIEARPQQRFRNREQLTARMEFLALARLVESRRDVDRKAS